MNSDKIRVSENHLLSTIVFPILISTKERKDIQSNEIIMYSMIMEVSLNNNSIIGYAKPSILHKQLGKNDDTNIEFNITMDHYLLSQIEKLRQYGNLYIKLTVRFLAYPINEPERMEECIANLDILEVPKSQWVEEILPALKYKNAVLIEVPVLASNKLSKVIDELNGAWKKYLIGDHK